MYILLSDASSLTSRQVATVLSQKGHRVDVLSPPGLTLTKLTRHVTRVHQVPPFGGDPYAWLKATLSIINLSKPDILVCTQEQVTILSAELRRIKDTGIKIAVPAFSSLKKVMDKVSASSTLREIGVLQPESIVLSSLQDLKTDTSRYEELFPAFAKKPIGIGSTGVRPVSSFASLQALCSEWQPFVNGGKLLLQKATPGSLLMVSGVFTHGKLVAWHACLRAREGVNGGASVKISLPLDIVREMFEMMGMELEWHGALSLDVILADGEKLFVIDINPRIVEPINGLLAGVDLVEALIEVSLDENGERKGWDGEVKSGKEGVVTHQSVLALLAAAKIRRVALMWEIWGVVSGTGMYKGSAEELTPIEKDWCSGIVLVLLMLLLLVGGRWMVERLAGDTVGGYAMSPEGWEQIFRRQEGKNKDGDGT